jgi:hypothetical protein
LKIQMLLLSVCAICKQQLNKRHHRLWFLATHNISIEENF